MNPEMNRREFAKLIGLSAAAAALPLELLAATPEEHRVYLPAYGMTRGAFGSNWVTGFQLTNHDKENVNVVKGVLYVQGTADRRELTFTLPPNATRTFIAPFTSSEPLLGGVAFDGQYSFDGTARLYNENGEGTQGQGFPFVRHGDLYVAGDSVEGILTGDVANYRNNAGWFQVEKGAMHMSLLDADGKVVAGKDFSFPAFSHAQMNLGQWLNAQPGPDSRVRFDVLSGRAAGYVSEIDNRSNDPTTKPLVKLLE